MLFDKVFTKNWNDSFLHDKIMKEEINKWLIFVKNKGQLDRFIPRLNSKRTQRDETLAEIASAYLMEVRLKYPIIKWEEKTVNNRDVEFVIKYLNDHIYCEVKSPGWESELSDKEKKSSRKKLPKYLNGESRTYSLIEPIQATIRKAYPKFSEKYKNLLIINSDFFVNVFDDEDEIHLALYEKDTGYFTNKDFSNLGGILFFEFYHSSGKNKIDYKYKFFPNDNAKKKFKIIYN